VLEIVGAAALVAMLVIVSVEGYVVAAIAIMVFLLASAAGWKWIMRQ
jgi:hypothetical protein